MDWNIDDIPYFIATVEKMGVSAAAEHLGSPKSTVSRAINRLEESLGVRLLERNSRNLRVTSEGETFYRRCLAIMEQVEEANAEMVGLTSVPSGKLVVSMPMAFSREVFAKHLHAFVRQYPHIDPEIIVTSCPVDIINEQIDVAIMVGPLDDSELVARPLSRNPLLLVGSPAYLHGHTLGTSIEELRTHIQVCETRYARRKLAVRLHDRKEFLDLRRVAKANDPIVVREAVVRGAGITLIPALYCREQLADGSLQRAFEHVRIEQESTLFAVHPSRRLVSSKVRAFLDFLMAVEELAS